MKKQLLIVGITIVLIVVGLSGCTDKKTVSDSDKVVGTWIRTLEITEDPETTELIVPVQLMTLNSDGTYISTVVPGSGTTDEGNWSIEDGKFIITHGEDIAYDYEFSDGDNILTLEIPLEGVYWVFNKQ